MDRLQRFYKLHRVISSRRHPVSRTTLEQELECPRATVKRIIQEMKLYFNAPLEYNRERNCYFYDRDVVPLCGIFLNHLDSRLMKQLAIRLSEQTTLAKSLVMRGNDGLMDYLT